MPVIYNNLDYPLMYTNSTSSLGKIYYGDKLVRAGVLDGTPLSATGGTIVDYDGWRVHMFTDTGSATFTVNSLGTAYNQVEVLIVGGGGSAGANSIYGGGGGGGGLVHIPAFAITSSGNIDVNVGGGGSVFLDDGFYRGHNGSGSFFAGIEAIGGGAGGWYAGSVSGSAGGSGGGSSKKDCPFPACDADAIGGIGLQPTASLPAGAYGYGNDGGDATVCSFISCPAPYGGADGWNYGGGGGGAGSAAVGRDSGSGLFYNWTGTNTEFAAGGDVYNFANGADNTGKGGSSGTGYVAYGASGGSGIVMVRYRYNPSSNVKVVKDGLWSWIDYSNPNSFNGTFPIPFGTLTDLNNQHNAIIGYQMTKDTVNGFTYVSASASSFSIGYGYNGDVRTDLANCTIQLITKMNEDEGQLWLRGGTCSGATISQSTTGSFITNNVGSPTIYKNFTVDSSRLSLADGWKMITFAGVNLSASDFTSAFYLTGDRCTLSDPFNKSSLLAVLIYDRVLTQAEITQNFNNYNKNFGYIL